MGEYNKEFIVAYYDCNKFGNIKPVSLLEYLVETSFLHSDSLDLGFEEMAKRDYAWVLSRWKIKVDRYPKARENIEIKTWISKYDKFYANREFNIYDGNKRLIAKASTLWVFMHTKRKRPIRIPAEIYNRSKLIDSASFDEFFNFNDALKSELPIASMDFGVRKTDIDYNNHVNNAKYLNWFLEPIPLDIDENYILKEIDIYYGKEIKYDNMIESKISDKKIREDKIEFFHEVYNKDTGELTTRGRSIWEKK